MTLSLLVGGALSGIQLVQAESGDFLVETGNNIGERRQTREEIIEGSFSSTTTPSGGTDSSSSSSSSTVPVAENISTGKPVTASSVGWGGLPSRATDGNTNGKYDGGSVTHSLVEENPWLEVDLGEEFYVETIALYNRTDYCCSSRLSNVYVLVSDTPLPADLTAARAQASSETYVDGPFGSDRTLTVQSPGRYVRVYVDTGGSTGILSLAEVVVNGYLAP